MPANSKQKMALLIVAVGGAPGDDAIGTRLEELGYETITCLEDRVTEKDYLGKALVVVSSLTGSSEFGAKLKSESVPVVVADGGTLVALGMVEKKDYGTRPAAQLTLRFDEPEHSLAATNTGKVTADRFFRKDELANGKLKVLWGKPAASAVQVAWLHEDKKKEVVFAYERGSEMADGTASGRRVGFFLGGDVAHALAPRGWALFDAAVRWAVGEELKQFPEVFTEEWREVRERRQRQRIESARSDESQMLPPEDLTGLALSGGGIRSATFCLGMLQSMAKYRALRLFDYVSTVSGGGYLGGWWSAWLAREGFDAQGQQAYPLFNSTEISNPVSLARALTDDCRLPEQCERHKSHNRFFFYCEEKIESSGFKFWREYDEDTDTLEELKNSLAKELNTLLRGPCLYQEKARGHGGDLVSLKEFFDAPGDNGTPKKRLSDETEKLLARADSMAEGSFDLMRLNRLLIEDAFPGEIRPSYFPGKERIEPQRITDYLREGAGKSFADEERRRQGGAADDDDFSQFYQKVCEERSESASDLRSAGRDPVHHLRLFANYLTPRKGLLSGDTWRAVAVITRDLIMTWLILLPVILAAVLAGQLYFVGWETPNTHLLRLAPEHEFVGSYPREVALAKSRLASLKSVRENMEAKLKGEIQENPPLDAARRGDLATTIGKLAEAETAETARLEALRAAGRGVLLRRLAQIGWFLLPIVALMVWMSSLWMILNNSGSQLNAWEGGVAVWMLITCGVLISQPDIWVWFLFDPTDTLRRFLATPYLPAKILALAAWVLIAVLLWRFAWRQSEVEKESSEGLDDEACRLRRREVRRSQTVRVQTWLVVAFVVSALVLLFAGFGHEVVARMFDLDRTGWATQLTRWGGIAATALSIAGAIFTAIKAMPAGGGDQKENSDPSPRSRIILAVTPPLIIVVLFCGAAWLSHWMVRAITSEEIYRVRIPPLTWAMGISILVGLCFVASEIRWRKRRPTKWLALLSVLTLFVGAGYYAGQRFISPLQRLLPLAVLIFSVTCILLRLAVKEAADDPASRRAFKFVIAQGWLGRSESLTRRSLTLLGLVIAALVIAALVVSACMHNWVWAGLMNRAVGDHRIGLSSFALAGLFFCLGIALTEIWRGTSDNRRSLWLLAAVNTSLSALLVISLFANYRQHPRLLLVHASVGLLTALLGWIVALGWLADPNAISLHLFYRARLVRAYLGASNPTRLLGKPKEVTESVEGDDLPLWSLKNCQRGGPYHLINTTLNLAGGRDLSTAQRSSASFVLSKLNCGSSRTYYRRTNKYMGGRLSLGTAVATSGAAASPNMGSRTPSASLAMLMTLLNVRLGFWAPTPNKEHWQLMQARLWPFYVLREFLSQTNDLSSYSYLTDGGHFDNTGLYPLVERGCRFIVLVDSGADPAPCFSDLGDAIRRCRIDFGAQIRLDVKPFFRDEKTRLASRHFIVGEIEYYDEHLKKLRWPQDEIEKKRKGIIVLLKPSLTSDETADVRQYGIENQNFPQQGTADQWFDESQFESYRQLGFHCGRLLFEGALCDEGARGRLSASHAPVAAGQVEKIFRTLFEAHNESAAEAKRRKARAQLLEVAATESQEQEVPMTAGCRYYLESLIASGAARIGVSDDGSQLEAARQNLRQIMRDASRRARRAGARELHERVLLDAADALSVFPFFKDAPEDHTNGERNGDT